MMEKGLALGLISAMGKVHGSVEGFDRETIDWNGIVSGKETVLVSEDIREESRGLSEVFACTGGTKVPFRILFVWLLRRKGGEGTRP